MNQEKNQALANEIADFISNNSLGADVRVYFNNKAYDWIDEVNYKVIEDIKASEYFEYSNNDESVSMSFEGTMYHMMNYGDLPKLMEKFNKIFERHNCYYELGYAWSLTVYYD